MPDTGDCPIFTADLCLGCGYHRRGIAADASCPECGESPPAPDCTALRGWSGTTPPWLAIGVGAFALALLIFEGTLLVLRVATTIRPPVRLNFGFTWVIIFGLAFGIRGLRRWRLRDHGGDIVWMARPGELEIREGRKTIVLTPDKLKHYRLERKPRRAFTVVSLAPKSSWSTDTRRTSCATNGDPAIDGIAAALASMGVELKQAASRG